MLSFPETCRKKNVRGAVKKKKKRGPFLRKIVAHQTDLNTFTITFSRQHANEVCHDYNLKSHDDLISLKETFGLCKGRAEQHHYIPVRAT